MLKNFGLAGGVGLGESEIGEHAEDPTIGTVPSPANTENDWTLRVFPHCIGCRRLYNQTHFQQPHP
jgi:hypothetical protein